MAESTRGTAFLASSIENRLLASLEPQLRNDMLPYLRQVRLKMGQVVSEPGDPVEYVYFPTGAVLSSLIVLDDGRQIELATIGNEGIAEVMTMFGLDRTPYRIIAQVPGQALSLPVVVFRRLLQTYPQFEMIIGRYLTGLFVLVAQSSACNRLHPIEERCARWLLMAHDRVPNHSFPMTQEFLASMLGARRPSVSVAMGILRKAGLIDYHRGSVDILDRSGLEAASCECYGLVRAAFDLLRGDSQA